ncbi:MAG: transposase [Candidatus Paceibacterota bacterium]|jgi:putative transposase
MERKVKFAKNEYYHLYSRGVEKRKIFIDKKDYERFMALLYILNQPDQFHFANFLKNKKLGEIFNEQKEKTLVSIISYTLMPNHFHILVYEKEDGGISKFMMRLLTAYSMYFNTKYERSGPLFTHPFRSQHVSNESQYLWIFSYIHLNPIKIIKKDFKENGIGDKDLAKKFLESYKYSSYLEYQKTNRPESKILDISLIPDYLKGVNLNIEKYLELYSQTQK